MEQHLFYFSPSHELYWKAIYPASGNHPETVIVHKIPAPVNPNTRLDNLPAVEITDAEFESFELRLALYGTMNELEACNHFGGAPLVRELAILLSRIAAGKQRLQKKLGGRLVTS